MRWNWAEGFGMATAEKGWSALTNRVNPTACGGRWDHCKV